MAEPALGTPSTKTVVIIHSFAASVEQLCARSPDAPSIERLRPAACACCGEPARDGRGILRLVGHGIYDRQVRGVSEAAWIVIGVRRFLCLACGHTISRLPDWLHPWRWYAATVIIEALYRHCVLHERARLIGARFGRPPEVESWRSLVRWRRQLLVSTTLWGWLGPRLGIRKPAVGKRQAATYLYRLLWETGLRIRSTVGVVSALPGAVRRSLRDLVHVRQRAGSLAQFLPGRCAGCRPGRARRHVPTEKKSGSEPP